MSKNGIEKLISDLEKEIDVMTDVEEKEGALARLEDIAKRYNGEDKVISFDEVADNIKSKKDELKIMSSWKGIDDLLGGFRLQQLVVVSALTKSGKTSWLMDLTSRIEPHMPLWLPFEESAEELVRKFIERGVAHPKAFSPQAMKGNSMEWVEKKIIEAIAKYGTQVIIIDQLDFLIPFNGDNHSLRVGQTMRDLKGLAKKWNVCIFIICHLVKTKMDTQPTLEDLKGSSSIGQEADTVILLWREAKREGGQVVITNNTNVSVQANRRTGKTGNVQMVFENGKFLEKEWIIMSEAEKAFNDI